MAKTGEDSGGGETGQRHAGPDRVRSRREGRAPRRVWQDRDRIAQVEYIDGVQVVRLRMKRRPPVAL